MIKKTVNYLDFDGNERTEVLYFNLTKTELVEIAMGLPDGLSESVGTDPNNINETTVVSKVLETLGNKGVLDFIKKIVLKSYGIKSPDGRRFEKSEEISREFSQTLAYDTVIMELMTGDDAAITFMNNLIPADVLNKPALPTN